MLFVDILDRKEGFLDCTKVIFNKSVKFTFLSKGLVHGFGQKWKISSSFVFEKNKTINIV